jgi:ubiquinone/menaquinone biosynthesis C-methylase UbiE
MSAAGEWFQDAFDDLYLSVYRHRDAGEADRFMAWAGASLRIQGARVLDLACGAARFARAVRRAGGRYAGLDLSRSLLRAARGNDPSLALVRADMRRLPLADESADVVLSMFTSFGYFESDAENRGVLASIGRVLRPGGRLLVDHMNAARVRAELVPASERHVDGYLVRERRAIREGRVVKEIEVSRPGEVARRYRESVRLLEPETLVRWAAGAGLVHAASHGDYDGGAFAGDSPRMLMTFRRGQR